MMSDIACIVCGKSMDNGVSLYGNADVWCCTEHIPNPLPVELQNLVDAMAYHVACGKGGEMKIECIRVRETDNAVLVLVEDMNEEIWFPLSQVQEMHFDKNDVGNIVVSDWIARQKGL